MVLNELSKFDEHFIKDYDENNNKGLILSNNNLEVDVECPKKLFKEAALNLHKDLLFLPEGNKI